MLDSQDQVRFEQLVFPHLDAAFNVARWLLRSPADAEDVAQEAPLRSYKFFPGFRGGDARAWLLQVVRNSCYSWMRKNSREGNMTGFDEELHGPASRTPEETAVASQDRARLTRALESLSPRSREVLVLRESEGCSYNEIAAITSISTGTVTLFLAKTISPVKSIL